MGVTPVFAHLDEALDGIPRTGVVHVGAHRGQEADAYRAAGFDRVVWVEPNPEHHETLTAVGELCPVACGARGTATLHVTRWTEQSSILEPTEMEVTGTVEVQVVPLSELQGGCNVAVVDVQGSEVDVLRSGDLNTLDAVIVEVDTSQRYEGAGSPDDIAEVLTAAGMRRASTWPHRWDFLTEEVWIR